MYVNAITHRTGYDLQLASACHAGYDLFPAPVCVCDVTGIGVCMFCRNTTCSWNRRLSVVRSRIATIAATIDIGVRMLSDHTSQGGSVPNKGIVL